MDPACVHIHVQKRKKCGLNIKLQRPYNVDEFLVRLIKYKKSIFLTVYALSDEQWKTCTYTIHCNTRRAKISGIQNVNGGQSLQTRVHSVYMSHTEDTLRFRSSLPSGCRSGVCQGNVTPNALVVDSESYGWREILDIFVSGQFICKVDVYKNLATYARHYFRLTPLYAIDHDCASVCRVIWKPTTKVFGETGLKCSLDVKEVQSVSKLEISLPCIKKKLGYNFQVSWSFAGKKNNVLVLNISFSRKSN